jgi:long-chain acyl-CoA synthetase
LLTRDPYIDQAVVYGDRKPFVTALIVPSLTRLAAESETLGITAPPPSPPSSGNDVLHDDALYHFMQGRVEEIMQAVSQPERVRAFLLLSRPFQVEAGEVTATLKVRRRHIIDKYRDRLEALYQRGE